MGDLCGLGSQKRPHIVWFGEEVPMIKVAAELVGQADIFLIIGTSLQVYPAAGLVRYFNPKSPMYIIDPKEVNLSTGVSVHHIKEKAIAGMKELCSRYL
jgi:NAD-dependent deacetylase